ncbi:MAG TPA: tripartite tricarboxylate transporter substrate binding protein [Crenalkalicoccus sp.]|jgi:tripartite-type tricarboxylate transporter receptor subunit TctC|nr:tripartite tricarboxylate transporter substrate binding protein [Crenalkalicoccus sp.]
MRVTRRTLGLLAAATALRAGGAGAAGWPDHAVRVVVPYSPGGGADTVARILFGKLGELLSASFVIENRGGGAGTIGAAVAAQAPPDGYTLLHDATAFSVNPTLFERLPYDSARDFRPVFLAALVPNLLLVHPSVPVGTVAEVIALAKATPGGLDWASSGNGTVQHMALELFARAAEIRLNHIPYRGGGPALADLIAGNVKFFFSNASSSTGHVQAGRVRAIAHTGAGRLRAFPELPPVSDTLPGFEAYEWNGVFTPAGAPDAVVERLSRALNQAIADPGVAERLAGLNVETRPNTPAEFAAYVAAETAKWGRVVREAGIRPD